MNKLLLLSSLAISSVANAGDRVLAAMEYAAKVNHVDAKVVKAICYVESRHDPKAMNEDDGGSPSYGLCQMKLSTAQFLDAFYKLKVPATPARLMKADVNAFYAAKLIKYYLNLYDNDLQKAIRAYNRGHFDGNLNSTYGKQVNQAIAWF